MPRSLLLALLLAGCADPPAPAVDPGALDAAPGKQPAVAAHGATESWIDLVAGAEAGHVRRGGLLIDPGAPGWSRASRAGGTGGWLPARALDGRVVALPDGIGGTLHFPVGEEGPTLRSLAVWLRPFAVGQRVSLFLDGRALSTFDVRGAGRDYVLRLPDGGLAPGEHSLRFYFRSTRILGRERTAAAVDDVRFLPEGAPSPLPDVWTGSVAGHEGVALLAGPPVGWSFYVFLPPHARFRARAAVAEGGPVELAVRLDVDGAPPQIVSRTTVAAGESAEIDLDLGTWGGQPVRLSLEASGDARPAAQAGWIRAAIVAPRSEPANVPPVRNVVLWVVDGLRDDRVGLGRGGERAFTPNLDLLAGEGAAATGVWSGAASPEEGHRRLLHPDPDAASLAALMAGAGRTTAYLTASAGTAAALLSAFGTGMDLRAAGEGETRALLRELDAWLGTRRRHPFFLYVATPDARVPLRPAPGYARLYERARPPRDDAADDPRRALRVAYDAQMSAADYWVGQAVALLAAHGILDETAVIVTGSVGQELREHGGLGDGHALVRELLSVPLVVWHPRLRAVTPRPLLAGGDLGDVAATALALAGAEVPASWPGRSLLAPLFDSTLLLPRPSRVRLGPQTAGRYGDWLLRGGPGGVGLWNLADDPLTQVDRAASHPIALRVLRDALLGGP